MPSKNNKDTKDVALNHGESLEIALDESEGGKYKITLPLTCDILFSPVDEDKKSLPVSSIQISDTQTIINVPQATRRWKLNVLERRGGGGWDPTGGSQSPGEDENGDRFIDWLQGQNEWMDEQTKEKVQNARKRVIIRKAEG